MSTTRRNGNQTAIQAGCRVRKLYGSDKERSGIVTGFEGDRAVVMWAPKLSHLDRQRRVTTASGDIGLTDHWEYSDSAFDGTYSTRDLELCT